MVDCTLRAILGLMIGGRDVNYMTLREVCDEVEVSRRAIQGYEKAGLVSATTRNRRGYLLYDVESRESIKQIKLFQELGFSVKEITEIIDAPKEVLKEALIIKIGMLRKKGEKIEVLIIKANELIERL